MNNATNNKSFGLGLTDINEVRKHIDDNIDDFLSFYGSYMHIEALRGYKNMIC